MTAVPRVEESVVAAVDDAVLFDMVHEAGTRLSGVLLALRRQAEATGDSDRAELLQARRAGVHAEQFRSGSRSELVERLRGWEAELVALEAEV